MTDWLAGSVQEVAWHVNANHAGGYGFRLCKLPTGGISELTEECFQQNHLDFVGDHQWVVSDAEPENRTEILAARTREGTFPRDSQWTKVPLEPPHQLAQVFDYIEVPVDLEAGQYVLSFRWDCQGSPQIWNACANINII